MPRATASRATVAGLGTTAVLLAAVLTVSLLLGGLVAYTASPAGPLVTGRPSLALPTIARDSRPATIALVVPEAPARRATPAPAAARRAAPAAAAAGERPRRRVPSRTGTPRTATKQPVGARGGGASSPGTTTATAGPPTSSPGTAAAKPVTSAVTGLKNGLADTTQATGQVLGGTVQAVTDGLGGAVGRANAAVGDTVKQVGAGVGTIVTAATDVLAGLVRGLGGPPSPPTP